VDEQEPRPLRPQQVAISERSNDDEWGLVEPLIRRARLARQAHGDHAGGGERPHVHSLDRLSVARDPERPAAEKLGLRHFDLWTYDGTLERIHHALYDSVANERSGKPVRRPAIIDSQSVKSAEKGGVH